MTIMKSFKEFVAEEVENYERSPFKVMKITIMASGARIKEVE